MATKKDRQIIFEKYDGRCAYCGCELQKGWHIDEVEPCRREYAWDRDKMKTVFTGYTHPERLHIDNQNPACASCNINKHSMSLEEFRDSIAKFIRSLNEYSTQYKIAKRYGLIHEVDKPVLFYFEQVSSHK
jgi:hypothetical protein